MIDGFHLGQGGSAGVVSLVHGFTGSPWDLEPVGRFLAEAGYEVHCRRLPGHGFPEGSEDNRWESWFAEAQEGLDAAIDGAGDRPIVVAGLSMGALITLQLARCHADRIRAIATFAPAVEVSTFNRLGLGLLSTLTYLGFGNAKLPKGGIDTTDEEVRDAHPGSNSFPFSAYESFRDLRLRTRAVVGEVTLPTLILHGALDTTCPVAGSAWLESAIGAEDVTRVILDRSAHVITRDVQLEELRHELLAFLARTLA